MNYFFAVKLNREAQEIIAEQARHWKTVLSLKPLAHLTPRWYDAEDYHITLKFLGDIINPDEDDLILRGMIAADKASSFRVIVSGTGAFPDLALPQALWFGVENSIELDALAASLDDEMAAGGFGRNKQPFLPHVTVARCTPKQKPTYVHIPYIRERAFVSFSVDSFVLMQTLPPEGRAKASKARYNIVHTFPFGGQPIGQGEIIG